MTNYWGDEHIELTFPKDKFKRICLEHQVTNEKELILEKVKPIFINCINQFFHGWLSSDDLSEVSIYLYNLYPDTIADDLKKLLDDCSELGYYLREFGEADPPFALLIIKDLRQYWLKNRALADKKT